MKNKRHYFNLFASILNTLVFTAGALFFVSGVIVAAINDNIPLFATLLTILSFVLMGSAFFVIYNGWAAWEVIDGCLVVTRLFRKKQVIPLDRVSSVRLCRRDWITLDMVDKVDCYAISSNGITVYIPKESESDALIEEIRKKSICLKK